MVFGGGGARPGDAERVAGPTDPSSGTAADPVRDGPLALLLVEDDDGDAFLVTELLDDAGLVVDLHRARTLDAALEHLRGAVVDCVLLDLGLPDSVGLSGVERLRAHDDPPALVVLTGNTGIDQGVSAVAAGADDYLVKGEVDGDLLGRSVRYAVQRRRSVVQQHALYRSEVRAAETARLERALLPTPLVSDEKVSVLVGYLPGGNGLLGGDFFDAVERADGTVLCVVGDVAGHGPDEAALGATLRTAWRTLVLADTPPGQVLPLLERVLGPERSSPEVFVTLCQLVIAPDRAGLDLYLAGHLAPLLLAPDGCRELPTTHRGRALGIPVDGGWRPLRVELPSPWSVMVYTDGLVESTVDVEAAEPQPPAPRTDRPPRLGVDGLRRVVEQEVPAGSDRVVERVLRRVRELHGGPLVDDAAILVIGWGGATSQEPGSRTATLADSAEWSR